MTELFIIETGENGGRLGKLMKRGREERGVRVKEGGEGRDMSELRGENRI